MSETPAPLEVPRMVDRRVGDLARDHAKYDNRAPYDESDMWALHDLARDLYALGWRAGRDYEIARQQGERDRYRDRKTTNGYEGGDQ